MISYGNALVKTDELLTSKPTAELYELIRNPPEDFKRSVSQLRIVYKMNKKSYASLKRTLPYFVCANFIPAYRKKENFVFADYFVVDIDHLTEKNIDVQELKDKLKKDSRVFLMFVSPSENGLKVMFRLLDRCLDSNVYSAFYRKFVSSFSQQYALEQVIDTVTCDVSRACFLSYDPDAYYNPNSESVNMESYVSTDNVFDFMKECRHTDMQIKQENTTLLQDQSVENDAEPDKQTLNDIKEKLGLLSKYARERKENVFVPEQLNDVADDIKRRIEETGVVVTQITDIYYGKQIKFRIGDKNAETNVFYSPKRNVFSVTASTRKGTDPEMNMLMKEALEGFLMMIQNGAD